MANDLKTYGDLKKAIKDISLKQKGEKIAGIGIDTIIGTIPVLGNIKTGYDLVKAFVTAPDTKKTKTWLDKLQIDDEMSAIVDDTVENGFMKAMAAAIEAEPDNKSLEQDFNMNAKLVNYLKNQYKGRTVTGIQENKDVKLKEYIKQLAREIMSEELSTGAIGVGAGPIMTPNWVAPKGQKKNAATKTVEKQGMKVTKGETEMPADSKVRDYVTLTGKKKKKVKIYHESNYDKASQYGAVSGYTAPSGYTGPSSASKGGGYYATDVKETMEQIIKEELLNEVTYSKFKNEVKFRTKNEQLHKAIREVKRKLSEIDRIVEYTSRMKQELSEGEEGLKYWKKTESNIATISEMVNQLNNKIKNLQ